MYKEDLALNNLQGLICHKTQPNQQRLTLYNQSDDIGVISRLLHSHNYGT